MGAIVLADASMTVATMIADVGTLLNEVVTVIAGNPVMSAFLGIALIGASARLFKRIRKSAGN